MKKIFVGSIILIMGVTVFSNDIALRGNKESILIAGASRRNMPKYKQEIIETRMMIKEKKLEIERELIKESPDFNKIEKLNKEIVDLKYRIKTLKLKAKGEYIS